MKKYFFLSFKAINGTRTVGGGCILVVGSCSHKQMVEALLEDYNKHVEHKADKIITTALTFLDEQTAEQLSENFTNSTMIIDDSDNSEDDKMQCIERWVARDKDGKLYLYFGKNPPKKEETEELWDYNDVSFIEINGSLFPEVQWSDADPKNVKLVIVK